jgi:hypothetical protein
LIFLRWIFLILMMALKATSFGRMLSITVLSA